jgi:hypothetical protein
MNKKDSSQKTRTIPQLKILAQMMLENNAETQKTLGCRDFNLN